MGGNTKTVVESQPVPSSGAATRDAIEAEIALLPQRYETELQYRPKFAQIDLKTLQQFSPEINALQREFATAEKGLQEDLYPEAGAIEKQLGQEIIDDLSGDIFPPEVEAEFLDQFRAEEAAAGRLGSPVGSVNVARKLAGLREQVRAQRTGEALSYIGRQPVLGSQSFNVAAPSAQPILTGELTPSILGYAGQTAPTGYSTRQRGAEVFGRQFLGAVLPQGQVSAGFGF